jgi:DNA-binding IclR family transcriptional regulator
MSPPASNLLLPLREGPASSTSLVRALQLPPPTLNRALQNLQRSG